jgi:hypothetical protein
MAKLTAKPAIYGLCCPDTSVVRYIGKANDPAARLKSHLRDARRRDTPVYRWIRKLAAVGKAPTMMVLEADCADWKASERALIAKYRAAGRLLNVADGGDEPFCSPEQRRKNGAANAAMIRSDPLRRRIWEIKRMIGYGLKRGEVSEAAKAKLRAAAQKAPHLFGQWAAI